MAASNTRFTQNSLGQSKNPIDSDHGIYRDHVADIAETDAIDPRADIGAGLTSPHRSHDDLFGFEPPSGLQPSRQRDDGWIIPHGG